MTFKETLRNFKKFTDDLHKAGGVLELKVKSKPAPKKK